MAQSSEGSGRYCAVLDGACTETQVQGERGHVFLAYPSEARIAGEMRELERLVGERGTEVVPWEHGVGSGRVVFCKLCGQIARARSFWADVTKANPNVMFEMGFALALGKDLRLFRDRTLPHEDVDLISDVDTIEYENAAELANRVLAEQPGRSLADQCQEKARAAAGDLQVLFVRNAFETTAASNVRKALETRLNPLGVRVRVDDPNELGGHTLYELAALAQTCQFVVVNLISTEREDSHRHNASAAFIAGYAVGSGRPVLILHEKPVEPIIDLKQVTKEYDTAQEAVHIVERWSDELIPEVSLVAKDLRERRQRSRAHMSRWALDLGAVAAEYDRLLEQCFVSSHAYRAALEGQRELFVGRRGAGKTANCIMLQRTLDQRASTVCATIAPEKMQLRSLMTRVARLIEDVPDPAVFEAMWRFVLSSEIASRLLRHYEEHPHLNHRGVADRLHEAFARLGCDPVESFDDRLVREVEKRPSIASTDDDLRTAMLQEFHVGEVAALIRLLESLPRDLEVFLLIDNLDQDWAPEDVGLTVGLINGLLNEAQRLTHRDLQGLARIVVFLRTDIYDVATRYDPNADKKTPIFLTWDRDSLFHLVTERTAAALREAGQFPPSANTEVWNRVFEERMSHGQGTFDYIVERTLFRPRDVLVFCGRCLDEARQAGHDRVTEKDVLIAEMSYSEDLFGHLQREYAVGYPSLQSVGIQLLDGPPMMSERDLRERLRRAAIQDADLAQYGLEHIVRFCYAVGLIGIQVGPNVYYSFLNGSRETGFSHVGRIANSSGQKMEFVVHKGLHKYLSIQSQLSE